MPDNVVLISTLGGIAAFGLNGFVIGPVIAAMFIAAWDIFSASREIVEDDGTIRLSRTPPILAPLRHAYDLGKCLTGSDWRTIRTIRFARAVKVVPERRPE